ncbi:putative uncharacterized protein [Prevotella sp. CAG:617]|nr:putative uncharacterized protein [Prevotella sp. CAG:617]
MMLELAKHIENLLFKNECVIVPQLGGFVTHYVPAHFNPEEGLYLPPSRSVGFNPQLQLNDGLLVQSYMQAGDLSFPEAVQQLEADVNQLKQQLQAQGFCQLEGIGRLTLGLNGKYAFEPDSRGLISPLLYAMEPTVAVPLSSTQTRHNTVKNRQRKPYTISINRRLADACIAALVALVVYFAWANDITTPQPAAQASLGSSFIFLNSAVSPKQQVQNNVSTSPVKAAPDTVVTSTPVQPRLAATQNVADTVKASTDTYAIVLASSITPTNAQRYVEQLHEQGLSDAYVHTSRRMVRVLYRHYSTSEQAQRDLNSLRSQDPQFSDAWVIKTRP